MKFLEKFRFQRANQNYSFKEKCFKAKIYRLAIKAMHIFYIHKHEKKIRLMDDIIATTHFYVLIKKLFKSYLHSLLLRKIDSFHFRRKI